MKAVIDYLTEFRIPKDLPHRERSGEESEGSNNFCNDEVWVYRKPGNINSLRLQSNCGITDFYGWVEKDDHFIVSEGCYANYEGARNALNAVYGIKFPECAVTNVESTIGRFETLEDYDYARLVSMPVMKNVERFLKACHSSNPRVVDQAKSWLANLEFSLKSVIDMDDPCRNPIHADGSKGYLA